jgi:hypothetical protein
VLAGGCMHHKADHSLCAECADRPILICVLGPTCPAPAPHALPCRAVCCAVQAKGANEASPTIPGQEWRTAIVLLSWITSGLFGVLFLVHLGRIGVSCCRKRRRGHGSDQDLEKAGLAAGRPPSAAVELGKEVANRCACVLCAGSGIVCQRICCRVAAECRQKTPAGKQPGSMGAIPCVMANRLGCSLRITQAGQQGRAYQPACRQLCVPCIAARAAACADDCFCPFVLLLCTHTQALHEQGPVWQRQGQAGPGPPAISRQHLPAGTKHLRSLCRACVQAARRGRQQHGGSGGHCSREAASAWTVARGSTGSSRVYTRKQQVWGMPAQRGQAVPTVAAGVCLLRARWPHTVHGCSSCCRH